MTENSKKEHPDLVCPECGRSVAWWNDYVDAYVCSSDWNGVDVRGKVRSCRTCEAAKNEDFGDRWDNFETEYSSSKEIGANKR